MFSRIWGNRFYIEGATPSEVENIWVGCGLMHLKGWFRDPMLDKYRAFDDGTENAFHVPPDADVARVIISANLGIAGIIGVFWASQESEGTRGGIQTHKGGFHWRIKGGGGKFHDIVFAELRQQFPNLITD